MFIPLEQAVSVAKRRGNKARAHLYVNKYQAKHIAADPLKTREFMGGLVPLARSGGVKKPLVIGFAETATAIGAYIAEGFEDGFFLTTTRERRRGRDYLEFSESHSHAAEQLLDTCGLGEAVRAADSVIIAEDEISTGRTVIKLIKELKSRYDLSGKVLRVVSVMNALGSESPAWTDEGIEWAYLYKIPPDWRSEEIFNYNYVPDPYEKWGDSKSGIPVTYSRAEYADQRVVSEIPDYMRAVRDFASEAAYYIKDTVGRKEPLNFPTAGEKILVMGTEEFMYPAILTAELLKKQMPRIEVSTHSTTRSPIEVSLDNDYAFRRADKIESLYEDGRQTYIYNLEKYGRAFILTDAPDIGNMGKYQLARALNSSGTRYIEYLGWRDSD